MSNKERKNLNEIDLVIRDTCRCGMEDGVVVTIEFISGFELFNNRPYHNHENWGQGYRIIGRGITYMAEDLDDAVKGWSKKVIEAKEEELS